MSGFDKDPENCDHENLEYHDMDVCDPEVVYENWTCRECGASVVKVHEPSHELVFVSDQDDPMKTREIS